MQRQTSKKDQSRYNDRSVDDFLKHIKRYNLKSERYERMLSPDPYAPYRQNTTHTLERSRTLSGKHSRKTNKTTRQKVQKMLCGSHSREKQRGSSSKISTTKLGSKVASNAVLFDPADLISDFSRRIRETQHFLQGKSKMGLLLCHTFLQMLNQIVENMVVNLQYNLGQLQKSISERLQRQIGERAQRKAKGLQKKLSKLQRQTTKLLQKQNINNNLIYHLRLQNIDIDQQFGRCHYNSDQFGGRGYHREELREEQMGSQQDYISSSELIFVRREEGGMADRQQLSGQKQWPRSGNKKQDPQ